MIERTLRFFRVVGIHELQIDRPASEIANTVFDLSKHEGPKWPWHDHFSWTQNDTGFRVVGQQDLHEFQIVGIVEPRGDHSHVILRHSFGEQLAKVFLSIPIFVAFMAWCGFLSLHDSADFDILVALKGSVVAVCGGAAFAAIFLAIMGLMASRQRSDDLSTVVSELHQ